MHGSMVGMTDPGWLFDWLVVDDTGATDAESAFPEVQPKLRIARVATTAEPEMARRAVVLISMVKCYSRACVGGLIGLRCWRSGFGCDVGNLDAAGYAGGYGIVDGNARRWRVAFAELDG